MRAVSFTDTVEGPEKSRNSPRHERRRKPGQNGEGEPAFGESAFSSYTFGPGVGTSWRTDTDVGFPGHVSFREVLRNMDADAAQPQAAGPGHWNDPDYLGPDQGLSAAQFRTQFCFIGESQLRHHV